MQRKEFLKGFTATLFMSLFNIKIVNPNKYLWKTVAYGDGTYVIASKGYSAIDTNWWNAVCLNTNSTKGR